MTGLFQPTAGQVRWDGVNLAVVDESSVYDRIAMVMQDPAQWPMSAEDNIRIGRIDRADPSGAALAAAARESGADTVIAELPAGGRTVLSRRFTNGRDLSGGQWQRISVAAACTRDAPILVATSHRRHGRPRRTRGFRSLPTATPTGRGRGRPHHHPISTGSPHIRHADQIIVLDHGRIVDAARTAS